MPAVADEQFEVNDYATRENAIDDVSSTLSEETKQK